MRDIKMWFLMNQMKIAWFLIGFLVANGMHSLSRGDVIGALIDFGLAYFNYAMTKD
jgi:hypothetical protein